MILAGTIVKFLDHWTHDVYFKKGGLYVVQRNCTDYQVVVNMENGGTVGLTMSSFKIVLEP